MEFAAERSQGEIAPSPLARAPRPGSVLWTSTRTSYIGGRETNEGRLNECVRFRPGCVQPQNTSHTCEVDFADEHSNRGALLAKEALPGTTEAQQRSPGLPFTTDSGHVATKSVYHGPA